jgi:hypothetical protein
LDAGETMNLNSGYPNPEGYVHVRTIISIVFGLSITRLFTGLARFVQHPNRVAVYPVHLAWVLFILLYVVEFWWWEFRLSKQRYLIFP